MTREEIIEEIERLELKNYQLDILQKTGKTILNSGYGFLSNEHSRYFDMRLAEAITSNGQVCVRGSAKSVIEKYSIISNIYSDTDSNFFSLEKIIKKRFKNKQPSQKEILDFCLQFGKDAIEPVLNNYFKTLSENLNFRQLTIGMEPECIADTTLFVAKKRYIMNKIWDEGEVLLDKPKRKIRGVEIVRSSTPMIVRNKLKDAVDLIFKTKNQNIVIEFINKFKSEFYKLPIEVIAFPRGVTFSDYHESSKGLPIGVKASFTYNKFLEIRNLQDTYKPINDSDKIKFCYIKKNNALKSHVIGFINKMPIELTSEYIIDYDEQYTKAFINPLEKIFDAIGWNIHQNNSIEDFFS